MIQGVRPSSFTKKLAKVNMPNCFSGLGKASKVNKIVLEMDNYHDVQWHEEDNKVGITIIFFKNYVFEWWTSMKVQKPEGVTNLIWVGFKEMIWST